MKWFILLISAVFFWSCTESPSSNSKKRIAQNKMERIIWDLMQVDEFVNDKIVRDSTKNVKAEQLKLYQQVFQLHKVSKEEFATSFKYYLGRPDAMKIVFDTINARANRQRPEVFAPKKEIKVN